MLPFGEFFGLPMTTLTACLGGIRRVHQSDLPASFLRFVGQELTKLIPTDVCNAFCKRGFFDHFLDL